MSSSQRSIARLPLHIFTDLIQHRDDNPYTPSDLRTAICRKLVDAGRSMSKTSPSLSSEGITAVGQIMRLTSPALLRSLDPLLTNEECNELMRRISQACTPEPITAKTLLQKYQNQCIPSDVQALDQCLRGGFRIGSVTEIVGRAGVGKTQLAMQLCVVAARMGFGSIFMDTERKLSLQRLNEIAKERHKVTASVNSTIDDSNFEYNDAQNMNANNRQQHHGDGRERRRTYPHPNHVMNNVTVHSPSSTDELLSVISKLDEEMILRNESATSTSTDMSDDDSPQYPVKLIILDSIAAPTRRDFGGGNAPQRVAAIFKIAQILKRIADQMQVAVVVINQIDKMQGAAISRNHQSKDSDFVSVTAALGTSWHHCVSTRVALEHERDPHREDDVTEMASNRGRVRTATIAKSNLVGHSTMSFEVTVAGIWQV